MFGLSHLFYPWGFIVQGLAIVHFVRRRPENYWFYIIFFGGFLGAGVYIVAEVLPSAVRMVLDLAEIDSIDSGGLGELVLVHMWAEAAGYKLKFASPRKSLRNLFEITNLVSVLDVYGSVPEAMTAMVQEVVRSS